MDDTLRSRRLPPLNPLRAFEATARHLSVKAAAAELHVTSSAISHQLRALETFLRVPLFRRERGQLKLTAHGAALLPAATQAFETIAGAVGRLHRAAGGDLAVSCVPGLLFFWLVPALRSFNASFPDVRLRLAASNDRRGVYGPSADVNTRYGDGNFPGLSSKLLANIDLFPVGAPSSLNDRPIRSIDDLARHVLLHADDGREWNAWLGTCDAQRLGRGPHHFYRGAHLATEAAIQGCGIALGDSITTSGLLARGRLVAPLDLCVPATDAFYVVTRPEARASPLVQAFMDWLFDAVARHRARGETKNARLAAH